MLKKIKLIYNNVSKPAKASFWFVISSMIQKGVSLITTPFFTRILTVKEYGTVCIYNSWLSIITIIATFELSTGVLNKAMIKYELDRDGYTSATLFLSTICSFFFFGVYILCPKFWNNVFDLNTSIMVMLFIEIIFSTAMSFWSTRNRFDFKYKSVIGITLLANIGGTLLSFLFVLNFNENRAEYRVLGILLVHIIVYGIVYILIIKKGKKIVDFSYWKYAIKYNIPLIPHFLSQQILNQSDRIMISRMINKGTAAIYSVAYQIAIVLNIVTNAVHASFSPWAFQKIRDKQYKQIGNAAFKIEICVCIVCFIFTLLAPEAIIILGGQTYYDAIWVVPPVTMSIVFNVLYTLIANIAFYYEKTKFIMFGTITSAIANIILNYIFIKAFGFVAAGYTTLVCYMLYSIVHYIFMLYICKKQHIQIPFNGKLMIGVAFIATAFSVVSTFLYMNNKIRYFVIVVSFVLLYKYRRIILKVLKNN